MDVEPLTVRTWLQYTTMMISVFSGLCHLRSVGLWPDNPCLQASMVTEVGPRLLEASIH